MGHTLLLVLPKTKAWNEVVDLLEAGGASEDVVSASAVAAERQLSRAADDPLFVETVRLLAAIPMAARSGDFGRALRDAGIPAGDDPGLLELIGAVGEHLDRLARQERTSADFGELSRHALLSSLSSQIGGKLPGFFEATPADVHRAAERMAGPAAFSRLARGFFTDLLSRTMSYWLDRTLSTHVGADRRFAHAGDRTAFDESLQQFCLEATRIISEFSAGWYGKRYHASSVITRHDAAAFGAVAFKKISSELRLKWGGDG